MNIYCSQFLRKRMLFEIQLKDNPFFFFPSPALAYEL